MTYTIYELRAYMTAPIYDRGAVLRLRRRSTTAGGRL